MRRLIVFQVGRESLGRNFSVVLELGFLASSKKRADFTSLILFDLRVRSGSAVGSAVPLGLRSAVSAEEVSRRET